MPTGANVLTKFSAIPLRYWRPSTLVDAVRHDGLGGVLARLELRPLRLLRRVGLLLPDFDVLVSGDGLLALWLLLVGGADLDKLRLGGDLGLFMGVQLGSVAIGICTLCGIWANCKSSLPASRRRAARVSERWPLSGTTL